MTDFTLLLNTNLIETVNSNDLQHLRTFSFHFESREKPGKDNETDVYSMNTLQQKIMTL